MSADDRLIRWQLARQARAADRIADRAAYLAARSDRARSRAVAHRVRVVRRARERLPVSAAVALGAASVALLSGGWHWLWFVAAGFGVRAIRAGAILLNPPRLRDRAFALPDGMAVPPLPPHPQSAAFPAVRRLAQSKLALARLLPLVAPAGQGAAKEAWQAAVEADAALQGQAARIAAVEPHRGAPADLMRTLVQGVVAQEQLVAAVADLVEASADPYAGTRLRNATDALHGLAEGLREVR